MPPGVPVASMGVGASGARNAGLFSARILALTDQSIATRYRAFVQKQKRKVRAADKTLQNERSSINTKTKRATREKN
jgi:phosphoribosylcarboxyaminoimidazole (NCAIR) mutase